MEEGAASSHPLKGSDSPSKEKSDSEDEDDEDLDFNPYLLNTPSPEASSGLSSENDGLEEENETVMSGAGSLQGNEKPPLESNTMDGNTHATESEDGHESGSVQKEKSSYEGQDTHSYNVDMSDASKRSYFEATRGQDESLVRVGTETRYQKSLEQTSGDFAALSNISGLPRNDDSGMETPLSADPKDEEQVVDAICRRTRAHYSLADLSLDELETFLQESDEEDYFQNVDDEEEYRKFVAAVQGSWKVGHDADMGEDNGQGADEEDEEDDYDFEIELEDTLESDYEEMPKQEALKRKGDCQMDLGHREAKRRRMERPLGLARTPLRPLLPSTSYKESDANLFLQETLIKGRPGNYGFTPCQRGQLQSLMHEHVQLLVQIFCITSWDPSQQEISTDTQRLLLQLAEARERILSWKRSFRPEICCCPCNNHVSMSLSYPDTNPFQPCRQNQAVNAPYSQEELACHSRGDSGDSVEHGSCPGAKAQAGELTESRQKSSPSTTTILSLLDVAQLSLVKGFLSDMAKAMEDLKRQHLKSDSDSVRAPLFPLSMTPNHVVTPPAPFQRKRTMAGVLIQDTKLNGIVSVPLEVCAVARRFIPFFNPHMFPYKPPPAALAKRLLFSEAEDELLAMGLMRYNTNWEKIQEHFLPCKTTHQIYVRQKNRSTAKAPENSIKAVRRLKMSPLTEDERLCIEEALKVYRNDWMKVWERCVPYRDPTTLSRLWRAASGIQKSYVTNAEAKEKHRMSEKLRRRKIKEKDEGEAEELISAEDACEGAYLHEAFLTDSTTQEGSSGATDAPPPAEAVCELPFATTNLGMPMAVMVQNAPTSLMTNIYMPEGNPLPSLGYSGQCGSLTAGTSETRSRKPKRKHNSSWTILPGTQMVKLAPGLPSLNLPSCVRVIRQSKFNQFASVAAKVSHVFVQSCSMSQSHTTMPLPGPSPAYSAGISGPHTMSPGSSQLPGLHVGNASCKESVKDSAPAKMHPLLMQTTFEIAIKNKMYPPGTSVADSPSLHNIPRFRPFLPASKGKSMQGVPLQVLAKPRVGELHPFLQQEEAEHQARSARVMAVPSLSTNPLGAGFTLRPSVFSDSVIRSQPRRAVQVDDLQQRELCAAVPNRRQEVGSKSSNKSGEKGRPRSCGKKSVGRTGKLGACKHRKEEPGKGEENVVMEQEELGDSEETEELVQFECEEIDDSETESSGQEKHAADLHKGDEGIEFEEEEIGSDDGD